jgi:hypothetical protein
LYKPRFAISLFDSADNGVQLLSHLAIERLLNALLQIDKDYLRAYPSTPLMYNSGVRYQRDPSEGEEDDDWQDIPTTLKLRYGDCEDLACWRAAELQVRGINAIPFSRWRSLNGNHYYHILVVWPDGTIEDPSRKLGMKV